MNYRIFVLSIIVLSFILSSYNDKPTNPEPNNYESVTIGTQVWMAKNLDVDHYRNGDSIPEVKDSAQWAKLTTGAWCYYNNDTANGAIYGKLYNWYAVNDSRGLAPVGWHIPTDAEWTTLTTYIGGESVAGGKLKEAGTTHWASPNKGATNETCFSALPGGCRSYYGAFNDIGGFAYWRGVYNYYTADAWNRNLIYYYMGSFLSSHNYNENYGFSVRCVKD